MAPDPPAAPTQIGQEALGVIGQTVIGATVIYGPVNYGSVTIIQGQAVSSAPSDLSAQPGQSGHPGPAGATAIASQSPPPEVRSRQEGAAPLADEPNPYQGLLAFQPADGERFFGREREIEELWQRFRALHEAADTPRLLVVYGPSGSGKSSLVRAGLVPALAKRPLGGRGRARIALLVPGSEPLQALATVLARIATNDSAPARKSREFAEELAIANQQGAHNGLRRLAALLPEADVWPLVVVVDQLEEVYNLSQDDSARQAFLANLLAAAADPTGQVSVVVTLRSDFLGATQADPALNRLIQAQGVFVAALSEAGLREAIQQPAARSGRPLEEAVVDRLVEQSLGRDGALPLLQFALRRLWEGLRQGRPAAETLRAIGGVGCALAGEADRLHQSLSADDQRLARRLFLSLVQMGEGSRDTRRRVALAEVIAHGDDPVAVRRVIERFASPAVRLLTRASANGAAGVAETLELTHEALIEAWPRLREWLNSDRADLRFQRRLEEAARLWQEHGQPGSLWRPPDLDLLDRFRHSRDADLTPRQLAFADNSRLAERKRRRQEQDLRRRERNTQRVLRGGFVVLSGLSLLALAAGGFAWQQLRQARAAQALQFEATHRALLNSDPFGSVVYGLAAAESLLEDQQTWEASQLSLTLPAAAASNRYVSMPIPTGQGYLLSLIELKNGDLISGGSDGTLRRKRSSRSRSGGRTRSVATTATPSATSRRTTAAPIKPPTHVTRTVPSVIRRPWPRVLAAGSRLQFASLRAFVPAISSKSSNPPDRSARYRPLSTDQCEATP